MFYKYEIKNNELYLYLTMNYEFSNELNYNNDSDLNKIALKYINTNNIDFDGNIINYVVDNIIVKRVNLNKCKSNCINNPMFTSNNYIVNIKLEDNSLCELTLHDYLMSILMENYNVNFYDEVYKCICILYNSYAYKCMSNDKCILGNNYFSLFKPLNYYRGIYNNYNELVEYFDKIIKSVDCMFMSYNKEFILPFMHYSNSGKTITNSKYPYLSSVESIWDYLSPNYIQVMDYSYEDFNSLLNLTSSNKSKFNFINQNNIRKLKIDDKIFTFEEIRSLLNLKSCDFSIIINKSYIRIITRGFGNSLGLSLFGANELAKDGVKYNSILKYYFPKVKLLKYIKELS